MAFKKENNYFKMLTGLVDFSMEAAESLNKTLSDFEVSRLAETKAKMHDIEHSADIKKHELIQKLVKEFITPIDSEDILRLAEEMDNVTDTIEDVLIKTYMYNISSIRPEAVEMSNVVVKCCKALKKISIDFETFRKSEHLTEHIIEVNRLEEECDRLYSEAMHRLFRESGNAVELLVWREMFESLENCCDACEHVSDVIESVIMKNS